MTEDSTDLRTDAMTEWRLISLKLGRIRERWRARTGAEVWPIPSETCLLALYYKYVQPLDNFENVENSTNQATDTFFLTLHTAS